jgi:Zn-finger nucleic acid-binding protein
VIYRDEASRCPRCQVELSAQGDGLVCIGCGGEWTDEQTLRHRWARATRQPLPPLTLRIDHERRLGCVVCGSPMEKVMLDAIELDRCPDHGLWFDPGELERVTSTAVLEYGGVEPAPEAAPPSRPPPSMPASPLPRFEFDESDWPLHREDFEIALNAWLQLVGLDVRAGDMTEARISLHHAIMTVEEALRRWPHTDSLELHLRTMRAKLATLTA